ncbi:MAG: DASS family sodium-coupled anion symporter [Verrucomicrobiota bacterium]|jgi:DASS family divalent anion:Na+ symporter|nr:DASS family sodium-coupled anion symporter [Verrucomicrobiota bacterium]
MAEYSKTDPEIHYPKLGVCLFAGIILWWMPIPKLPEGLILPEGADFDAGWHVFAVFAATILSFILRPVPMGPAVLLALVVLAATNTLGADGKKSFETAMAGYGNKTVWLVVGAFLIAGAMIRTGLGRRIALGCVVKFGKTTLGLGYATAVAEFILGPAIPSNTARGGGIMAPIVNSLARALGSTPEGQPKRAGEYLMLNGAHLNLITAAMFLTGMAANSYVVGYASKEGLEFGWLTWLKGSIVPGLASLLLLPWFLCKLLKPEMQDARAAQNIAKQQLSEMGVWTRGEKIMVGVFVSLLILWVSGKAHGMDTGVVALIGVLVLVLTGTEKWEDITGNKEAWDAMVWLGGMVCMAGLLKDHGFIAWFAEAMKGHVKLAGMGILATAVVLALVYFYSMYGFSMLTGHIMAMVAAFLAVALVLDVPGMLIVALLAYFSNLCGCLTNYSTGPVVIYSGFGYVPVARWFKIGFIVSLFHLVVWLGVGLPYWKLLGWW